MSAVETVVSTAVGFIVSYLILWAITTFLGWRTTAGTNFVVTLIYTVASLVRGYFVRRFFNWLHHRPAREELNKAAENFEPHVECLLCGAVAMTLQGLVHSKDCRLYAPTIIRSNVPDPGF